MADRVVVMRAGRVDQIASPRDLYEAPARVEVARFIGAPPMALLPATADGAELAIDGTALRLRATAPLPERVLLGIRAEDVAPESGPGAIALPARAGTVELLGGDVLVQLQTGAAAPLTARFPVRLPVVSGDPLTVGIDPDRLHLFDAAGGQRIGGVALTAAPGAAAVVPGRGRG